MDVMARVTIRELCDQGGEGVDRAARGEQITVTRSGRPVAELRAVCSALGGFFACKMASSAGCRSGRASERHRWRVRNRRAEPAVSRDLHKILMPGGGIFMRSSRRWIDYRGSIPDGPAEDERTAENCRGSRVVCDGLRQRRVVD